MAERVGDFIYTHTGTKFYPLDPRPEEIHIEDIAHSLGMQCRYTGHTSEFYSIAEHSFHVSNLVPSKLALAGLLHDASEAYLVDVPRPIKHFGEFGRLYSEMEDKIMQAVAQRFGIPEEYFHNPMLKDADQGMIYFEAKVMMPPDPVWDKFKKPLNMDFPIYNWTPPIAKEWFLRKYDKLTYGTRHLTA